MLLMACHPHTLLNFSRTNSGDPAALACSRSGRGQTVNRQCPDSQPVTPGRAFAGPMVAAGLEGLTCRSFVSVGCENGDVDFDVPFFPDWLQSKFTDSPLHLQHRRSPVARRADPADAPVRFTVRNLLMAESATD